MLVLSYHIFYGTNLHRISCSNLTFVGTVKENRITKWKEKKNKNKRKVHLIFRAFHFASSKYFCAFCFCFPFPFFSLLLLLFFHLIGFPYPCPRWFFWCISFTGTALAKTQFAFNLRKCIHSHCINGNHMWFMWHSVNMLARVNIGPDQPIWMHRYYLGYYLQCLYINFKFAFFLRVSVCLHWFRGVQFDVKTRSEHIPIRMLLWKNASDEYNMIELNWFNFTCFQHSS